MVIVIRLFDFGKVCLGITLSRPGNATCCCFGIVTNAENELVIGIIANQNELAVYDAPRRFDDDRCLHDGLLCGSLYGTNLIVTTTKFGMVLIDIDPANDLLVLGESPKHDDFVISFQQRDLEVSVVNPTLTIAKERMSKVIAVWSISEFEPLAHVVSVFLRIKKLY